MQEKLHAELQLNDYPTNIGVADGVDHQMGQFRSL